MMTFRDVLKENIGKEVDIIRRGENGNIDLSFSGSGVRRGVKIKEVEEDFFVLEDKEGRIRMYAIRAIVSIV